MTVARSPDSDTPPTGSDGGHAGESRDARLARVVRASGDAILVVDAAGVVRFANPAAERLLHAPGGLVGTPFGFPLVPGGTTEVELLARPGPDGVAGDGPRVAEMRVAEMRVVPLDWDGRPALLASLRDVTDRRRAETQARERERLVRDVLDSLASATLVLDADGVVTIANRSARRAADTADGPVVAEPDADYLAALRADDRVSPSDGPLAPADGLARVLAGDGDGLSLEYRVGDGDPADAHWYVLRARPLTGDRGGAVVSHLDVTPQKRAEVRLAHQAMHDALTGLPNRPLLLDRLTHALAGRPRRGTAVAVLFCDLDGFKLVNDTLGHDTGDRLLVEAAERLRAVVRPDDTVARFGGDEFVVLCTVDGPAQAGKVAERLVAALSRPFLAVRADLRLGASVGVALARPGDSRRPEDVLGEADAAMYRAKERGRGRWELFDQGMRARAVRRLAEERTLQRALEGDGLRLALQPEVSLATGDVVGVEALARCDTDSGDALSPSRFVPLAEETGLIVPLGHWVLREACRQAAWLRRVTGRAVPMWVNLSARQLAEPGVVDVIADAAAAADLPPAALGVEVTESATLGEAGNGHAEHALSTLMRLRSAGVRVGVDDFGAGWSSLAHLRRLAPDVLKVDRSLVDGVDRDPEDAALVAAAIGVARALDLSTVAEGVETAAQAAALRSMGCDAAQGHHFASPQPIGTLVDVVLGRAVGPPAAPLGGGGA